ncbi:MAG TPA: hypothetical protein VKM72_00135 [Thermoanaerobaculia bacterium]|nr:hypothetical protein [Thermoanaerobaculia bacterium]
MHSQRANHLAAEGRRVFAVARRYPLQTFSGILTVLVIFISLFTGAQYLAGSASVSHDRQGSLVLGLVLWNLLILSLSEISRGIQAEAQIGTLEHLFLASQSLLRVMLFRAFSSQVLFLAMNSVILVIVSLTSRTTLSASPAIMLPILAALLATNGIGLALGALALLWKRIGAAVGLVQFLVVSLVVPPFEQLISKSLLPWTNLLPLAPAARALRSVMARQEMLGWTDVVTVLANGCVYFLLGVFVFRLSDKLVRERGALAGY